MTEFRFEEGISLLSDTATTAYSTCSSGSSICCRCCEGQLDCKLEQLEERASSCSHQLLPSCAFDDASSLGLNVRKDDMHETSWRCWAEEAEEDEGNDADRPTTGSWKTDSFHSAAVLLAGNVRDENCIGSHDEAIQDIVMEWLQLDLNNQEGVMNDAAAADDDSCSIQDSLVHAKRRLGGTTQSKNNNNDNSRKILLQQNKLSRDNSVIPAVITVVVVVAEGNK